MGQVVLPARGPLQRPLGGPMAVSARQSHNVFWNGVACGDVSTSLTSCGSG